MAASVATWSFGILPVVKVKSCLLDRLSATDAVETAIAEFEDDIKTGVYHVGRGGLPNYEGIAQYDAAIMDGKKLSFGAVAALEGVSMPIKVARRVMTHCPHNMLVGEGAQKFAINEGFKIESNETLLSKRGKKAVEDFNLRSRPRLQVQQDEISDTLGVIALDKNGNIAVGVSSSGMALKHPGRVGDSPLIGAGLYADNKSGAACCTGDGDEILKYCPAFHICNLMGMGKTPQQACDHVVKGVMDRNKELGTMLLEMGVVAMDMKGNYGAAGTLREWEDTRSKTVYYGFPYSCWNEGKVEEIKHVPSLLESLSA